MKTGNSYNQALCSHLKNKFPGYALQVTCADFLSVTDGLGLFPRIIMNPPFENGADIKHIMHAQKFLKPGGKLVALCANGPRQQAALKDMADHWEPLPAGSFKEQGTGVNVAMLVLSRPCEQAKPAPQPTIKKAATMLTQMMLFG